MTMINWTQSGPAIVASFLSSMVEFVEALTIVLAAGVTRGWRSSLLGAASAAATLSLLVLAFGPSLQKIPIHILQLVIGILLLLFGMRWARKAILRAAGLISLHDEALAFEKQQKLMRSVGVSSTWIDPIGFIASFKGVLLEGLEVVFIVIAVGSTANSLSAASLGAAAAGLIVIIVGIVVHRPLTKVPENVLKFTVGVLLSAFGTFWVGEGLGLEWVGSDLAIVGLAGGYLIVFWLAVNMVKQPLTSTSK